MNKTALLASTLLAMALAAAQLPAAAQTQGAAATLTLEVREVRDGRGPVMVALFDSEARWRGSETGAVRTARVEASAGAVRVSFANLSPGQYAIRLFQDIDANGELNTSLLGIPSEPYGFSNNAPVRFGPPSWSEARFSVQPGVASHAVTLTR